MRQSIVTVSWCISVILVTSALAQTAYARGPKGFGGLFKNFGQQRSTEQKGLNVLHPTGRSRSTDEQALDLFRKKGK